MIDNNKKFASSKMGSLWKEEGKKMTHIDIISRSSFLHEQIRKSNAIR